jgi:hypothetical protein
VGHGSFPRREGDRGPGLARGDLTLVDVAQRIGRRKNLAPKQSDLLDAPNQPAIPDDTFQIRKPSIRSLPPYLILQLWYPPRISEPSGMLRTAAEACVNWFTAK